MSILNNMDGLKAVEKCTDDLMQATDCIGDRYPPDVFAAAWGVHLACLARALREAGAWTPGNVRAFFHQFEREAQKSEAARIARHH